MTPPMDAQSLPLAWSSLPFVLAAILMTGLALYALFVNGPSSLRAAFLMASAGMVPALATMGLAGPFDDVVPRLVLYRIGLALLPVGGAGVLVFECVLARVLVRYRWYLIAISGLSFLQTIPMLVTDWYIADWHIVEPWGIPWSLPYPSAGPLFLLLPGTAIVWLVLALWLLVRQLRGEPDTLRQRQIKISLIGICIIILSAIDVPLAYGKGICPISWVCLPVGGLFLFRSLLADTFVDSRTVDRRGLYLLAYALVAALGVWMVWDTVDRQSLPALITMTIGLFAVLRVMTALIGLTRNPSSLTAGTPLERLLEQFTHKVQGLHATPEIGAATAETLRLALGCELSGLLVPIAQTWAWETSDGEAVPEDAQPHPFTVNWLLEHPRPLQRSEIPGMRLGELRLAIERLFEANVADIIVPLVNRDDMVGLLVLGFRKSKHPLTREELDFLAKITEHLSATLIYARMHREVNRRVAAHKEVELAAAVQRAFVPKSDQVVDCGLVQLSGLWAPALQCGGDWWSVHQLPDGRVLVLIGDVTGHGVAAAMIAAAAKGCYDVAEQLMGNDLDLVKLLDLLDASVRQVGADRLHMTCFATLLDPRGGKIHFANAGHAMPYICRERGDGAVELGVLVARGNPLGSPEESPHHACTRDLRSGDVLILYTDGIIECTDPDRQQFGDRRFQRLLRRIDRVDRHDNPRAIRDHIIRAVAAFQRDQTPDDDITLVVACIA